MSVSLTFDLTSSAIPTSSDENNLKANIISKLNIDASTVKGFSVSYSTVTTRRYLLVTTYLWTTSFTIVIPLTSSSSSSGVELTSFMETSLTSSNFTDTIQTSTGASVDTSTVIGSLITRQPTAQPSLTPTSLPSLQPSISIDASSSSNKSDSTAISAATLGIVIVIVLLIGCLGYVSYSQYKTDKVEGDAPMDRVFSNEEDDYKKSIGAEEPTSQPPSLPNLNRVFSGADEDETSIGAMNEGIHAIHSRNITGENPSSLQMKQITGDEQLHPEYNSLGATI